MSTASLRKDHDLIEKVLNSMEVTLHLLQDRKKIPDSILMPVIDFAKNFTIICHHGKEENSLFPALERTGMPTKMGPIAVMLMEHQMTKEIATKMEISAANYLQKDDPSGLISDLQDYITHVRQHLWKENNRLFMMAEMRLQGVAQEVDAELEKTENVKLSELGKNREFYENLAKNLLKI